MCRRWRHAMATRDHISQPRTTEHPQYAAMTPTVQRRVSRQANDIAQWLVILRYPYSASYKVQVHQPETPAHQGDSRHRGHCRHGPPNTCNAFGRYLGHRRQCPGALTILVGDNIGEQHHRARGGRGEQQLQHRVFGIGHRRMRVPIDTTEEASPNHHTMRKIRNVIVQHSF